MWHQHVLMNINSLSNFCQMRMTLYWGLVLLRRHRNVTRQRFLNTCYSQSPLCAKWQAHNWYAMRVQHLLRYLFRYPLRLYKNNCIFCWMNELYCLWKSRLIFAYIFIFKIISRIKKKVKKFLCIEY